MASDNSDRFEQVFKRVDQSSSRTRSALYVFMVVNFALFLTAFGSNIYRRPIERLTDFIDATVCWKNNLPDSEKPRPGTRLECKAAINLAAFMGFDFAYLDKAKLDDGKAPINLSDLLVRKRLEALVSEEAAGKRVQIPFVGFAFEIDYLWLLTSFFGPLGMILILSCIQTELHEIEFAKEFLAGSDPEERSFRARLLLSTQVLLHPNDTHTSSFVAAAQRGFVASVFCLPLLTQLLIIYYDWFLVDLPDVKFFLEDLKSEITGHPVLQITWFAITGAATVAMFRLAWNFRLVSARLRGIYSDVKSMEAR